MQEAEIRVGRDYIFAPQGSLHAAKWCVAMTTGRCSSNSAADNALNNEKNNGVDTIACDSPIAEAVRSLQLEAICPGYRVVAPL